MIMTSKGGFGCGLAAGLCWIVGALLFSNLPAKPEDFWHGLSYIISTGGLFLGGIVLAITATEADPPK